MAWTAAVAGGETSMAQHGLSLYPAFLDLRGVRVLVVGGGAVAARKARVLVRGGARVTAVAKRFGRAWRRLRGCRRLRRAYRSSDLDGARLVFAATEDRALNARIAAAAERRGVWANVAAPPDAGRLIVPASIRRGRLCVAISTGGASAAASRALRMELAARLAGEWAAFLELVAARRERVRTLLADPRRRRRLLRALGSPSWIEALRRRGAASVGRAMDARIARAAGPDLSGKRKRR